jgi:tRNA(fMet)-specific endonuclease VapC
MIQYMLDTNICIFTIKNKPPHMQTLFKAKSTQLCISQITAMELFYGVYRSQKIESNLHIIEGFISQLDLVPYDLEAAHHTAQIRANLSQLGTPIGPYDGMIAGSARSRGLVVVSNNLREFHRVSGLQVEDWTQL